MICARCLFRASTRQLRASSCLSKPISRTISSTSTQNAAAAAPSTSPQPQRSPPAATSTSAAQPFSTPLTPSVGAAEVTKATKAAPQVFSSVPAGTVLKGLNYFKNKPDPVALEDHEYPDWLWTVLAEKKKGPAEGQKVEMDPRLFSKSAKARRVANKRARKEAQMHPEPDTPQVPIYEQSIDLPAEGDDALTGRLDLTKAMRGKRRRDIKEANFLKGMS